MVIITEIANFATKIKWNDKRGMFTIGDFYKNYKFGENSEFGKKKWMACTNSNEMAKNGPLVVRDFYEDGKFWRKWQIWEKYMKGLNKIQMCWQIFAKNGEFDKS